ncbi:MAG: type I 3-dehydroquinate dehydratase [Thermoplasmata archaeon]|nr:type I 3-dehydroquinate dehydratase [Thermoplasmata archaeon]
MSAAPPLLIVTLPGRTLGECREEIAAAGAGGADVAEVRLDRWKAQELDRIGELFPSVLPLMATYRSKAEGGEAPDEAELRARIRTRIASFPFAWIDLETERDRAGSAEISGPRVVFSSHLPAGTGPTLLRARLRDVPDGSVFAKVVVPCTVSEALRLRTALGPPDEKAPSVLHTTGASGPLFRATAWRRRFPAVYARLPDGFPRPPVERSQIPVEALRHYFGARTPGPLYALLGHPVAHSRSPAIFADWMRRLDDRGLYVTFDLATEEEFGESLGPLCDEGFRGFNVTSPWKQVAFGIASSRRPSAEECGAANVLSARAGGGLEAENTDLFALVRRLGELIGAGSWSGDRVTIVGTGGAARAALAASRSIGAQTSLVGRSPEDVDRLAREFGATPASRGMRAPELVIHATSIGQAGAGPPGLDLAPWVGAETHVLDLVYDPQEPIVRDLVAARGRSYEDGRRLLVYQAAESYRIWWGHAPGEEEIALALRTAS